MVVRPRLPGFDRVWVKMFDEETGLPLVNVEFLDKK